MDALPMRRRIHVSYEEEDTCVMEEDGCPPDEEEDTCVI
jgi:hypothetical protein